MNEHIHFDENKNLHVYSYLRTNLEDQQQLPFFLNLHSNAFVSSICSVFYIYLVF